MSERPSAFLLDMLQNRIPLTADGVALGRAADCGLIIADPRVSRHHAELRREGDGFLLVDLDSTNGTFLNGQSLTRTLPLRDGDMIEWARRGLSSTIPTLRWGRAVSLTWYWKTAAAKCGWTASRYLSLRQYALLHLLWSRCGLLCSRDEIVRAVWPECPDYIYDYQKVW